MDTVTENSKVATEKTVRNGPRHEPNSLWPYVTYFFHYPTSWLRLVVFSAIVITRISLGSWKLSDAFIIAGFLLFEPFTEWLIHVYVLHAKPKKIFGKMRQMRSASGHQHHHQYPNDLSDVLVKWHDLIGLAILITLLSFLISGSWPQRVSVWMVSVGIFSVYEWTHYLIHTSYRPKSKRYKSIWRSHRLHHFRNENYWMGVTTNRGDKILGTFPEKTAVPLSPTAKTLA